MIDQNPKCPECNLSVEGDRLFCSAYCRWKHELEEGALQSQEAVISFFEDVRT